MPEINKNPYPVANRLEETQVFYAAYKMRHRKNGPRMKNIQIP
jgi:hypothetical protein